MHERECRAELSDLEQIIERLRPFTEINHLDGLKINDNPQAPNVATIKIADNRLIVFGFGTYPLSLAAVTDGSTFQTYLDTLGVGQSPEKDYLEIINNGRKYVCSRAMIECGERRNPENGDVLIFQLKSGEIMIIRCYEIIRYSVNPLPQESGADFFNTPTQPGIPAIDIDETAFKAKAAINGPKSS